MFCTLTTENKQFVSAVSKDGITFQYDSAVYGVDMTRVFNKYKYMQLLETQSLDMQVLLVGEIVNHDTNVYLSQDLTVGIKSDDKLLPFCFMESSFRSELFKDKIVISHFNQPLFEVLLWENYSVVTPNSKPFARSDISGIYWFSKDVFVVRVAVAVYYSLVNGDIRKIHTVCSYDIVCDKNLELRGVLPNLEIRAKTNFISELCKNSFLTRYAIVKGV